MTITGVVVSTEYEYVGKIEDDFSGGKRDYLKLQIPIPGGEVIFKYTISKEQVAALESAVTLVNTKKK